MAADDPKFGVKRFSGVFIDEVTTKEKTKVAERANRVGVTKRVIPYDPQTDVTIKGGGEPPLALGYVSSPGVTGLTGGVFIVNDRLDVARAVGAVLFDVSIRVAVAEPRGHHGGIVEHAHLPAVGVAAERDADGVARRATQERAAELIAAGAEAGDVEGSPPPSRDRWGSRDLCDTCDSRRTTHPRTRPQRPLVVRTVP